MNPDWKRGLTEARQHFDALGARWPRAFPASDHDVQPLASGAAAIVAAGMGWPEAYARGVLRIWKARSAFCRACLIYPARIALDGAPTEERVDDAARAMAREQLQLRKRRREAERKTTAEKPAKTLPPPPPAPEKPADVAPPPPQEEPRKRAGLERCARRTGTESPPAAAETAGWNHS